MLPPGAPGPPFGVGRAEFPIAAQAWLAGGHVRVGLEDNVYLEKGVLAPDNAALVAQGARDHQIAGRRAGRHTQARATLGLRAA